MSTQAQILANRQNAQHSTGPTTQEGKAASSNNHFQHGLTGAFTVLPFEDQQAYDHLFHSLNNEHQPQTITEHILVEKMAQAHWLSKRAQRLQELTMGAENLCSKDKERRFALFLRYQTTNDRGFRAALNDLLKLRAERRKQEIGFESQERKRNQETRKQAAETRKQDHHKFDMLLAEARLDHQLLQNLNLEISNRNSAGTQTDALEAQQAS